MTTANTVALEVATLDAKIKELSAQLSAKKAELVEIVGYEGEVIQTVMGKVTVTKQTSDRRTGQFKYGLGLDSFLALDERVQANLVKQGVVTKEEKITKGQAPVVKVSAS